MMLTVALNYLYRGVAVALAAYYIPQKVRTLREIAVIAVTVASAFLVLDLFSPVTGMSAERGAGLGMGMNMVGGEEGKQGGEEEQQGGEDDDISSIDTMDTA